MERPKKKRLTRIHYSSKQRLFLEARFRESQYPNESDRKKFADHIDVTEYRVMIWFQNRRKKAKEVNRSPNDSRELEKISVQPIIESQHLQNGNNSSHATGYDQGVYGLENQALLYPTNFISDSVPFTTDLQNLQNNPPQGIPSIGYGHPMKNDGFQTNYNTTNYPAYGTETPVNHTPYTHWSNQGCYSEPPQYYAQYGYSGYQLLPHYPMVGFQESTNQIEYQFQASNNTYEPNVSGPSIDRNA